jgi:hypothetical protein
MQSAWKLVTVYLVVMFLCALAVFLAVGCVSPAGTCRDAADGQLRDHGKVVLWCAP